MKIGVMGFPQSGKTTLFNVLTQSHAPTGAFASSSGGINVGTVQVPDSRLAQLRDMFEPKKYTPARIEYVDLAGQETQKKNALLPQQILSSDLLLVVVRAFEDPNVHHPKGVDAKRDVSDFLDELLLRDMSILEGRLERVKKSKNSGVKETIDEAPMLETCLKALEDGQPLRQLTFDESEEKLLRGYQLLTLKPLLVVLNVGEDQAQGAGMAESLDMGGSAGAVEICGKAEMEIADLEGEEQTEFMELLGITESGLSRVIRASYDLLGLVSFFTVGTDEVRAWNIRKDTPAVLAAGAIHSDLQRGFIRAEVIGGQELLEAGGLSEAKQKNLLRVEGKEYLVQDGEVLNIRFSV